MCAWITLLLWCWHSWQRQLVMSCAHHLQLPWDERAALKPWQSFCLNQHQSCLLCWSFQLLFFLLFFLDSSVNSSTVVAFVVFMLHECHCTRIDLASRVVPHFQVNLTLLSHFYCLSARRSARNSLCHAAHNDIGADPLAGKTARCNQVLFFDVSLFSENP